LLDTAVLIDEDEDERGIEWHFHGIVLLFENKMIKNSTQLSRLRTRAFWNNNAAGINPC